MRASGHDVPVLQIQRPGQLVSLRPVERLYGVHLRSVLLVSVPAFAERIIFHTAFVIFAGFVGHLGDQAMTANQACLAVESLGFIAASGFGIASGALVAQKLGAGRPKEAQSVGWISMGLGSGLLTVFGLLFVLIPETLVGWIISDPEAIALGATCLRITAISQPLMAIHDTMAGALRGAGDTRSPMLVTLVGCGVMRLGACYVLAWPMGLGLIGVDWNNARLVRSGGLGHRYFLARPLEDQEGVDGPSDTRSIASTWAMIGSPSYYDVVGHL